MTRTFTKDINVRIMTTGYKFEGGVQKFLLWNVTAPAGLVKTSTSVIVKYLEMLLTGIKISEAAVLMAKVN